LFGLAIPKHLDGKPWTVGTSMGTPIASSAAL
jgi:hypothetical protein